MRHLPPDARARGRREFLAWLSATPLILGCSGGPSDPSATGPAATPPPGGKQPGTGDGDPDRVPSDGGDVDDAGACRPTTSDAEGPYYVDGAPERTLLAAVDEPGVRLLVEGRLLAADCRTPLAGYTLDVWQADEAGTYHDGADRLRGKVVADGEGRYRFETILPGRYGDGAGIRPAHLHAKVLTPMGNALLTTQLYFEGDPYLGQADYCTRSGACNSGDAARVLRLADATVSGKAGKRATFDAFLART